MRSHTTTLAEYDGLRVLTGGQQPTVLGMILHVFLLLHGVAQDDGIGMELDETPFASLP